MSAEDDEFLRSLQATFKVEADEHLQAISAGLLELEKASDEAEQGRMIEVVFRAAHSLKGAARAVNFREIESICQSMEDVFASWKNQESTPTPELLDTVHQALDAVTAIIASPTPSAVPTPVFPASAATPESTTESFPSVGLVPEPFSHAKNPSGETIRVSVTKLDGLLLDAEEMLGAKLATGQRVADLREVIGGFEGWTREWTAIQPEIDECRQGSAQADRGSGFQRVLEFVDWTHDYLRLLESKVATLSRSAEQDRMFVGRLVDDLLEGSKNMLMVPLATLGTLFPKLVRDLCRDQGKEAELVMRGDDIEIDKRILEEMKDPLIHILRNCIDHGLESPEERARLGKPHRATVTIAVSRVEGSKVELLVSDDGSGIDVARVKNSAIRHGLLSIEESRRLSEAETLALIFRTDVSTSPIITQLSGRGLGLAIVREKTEKLGGRVSVESRPGEGTTFRIILPVALATFRGILVEVAKRMFIVPTANVERVLRFRPSEVQTVEGRETLALNGRTVSLARLSEVLGLPSAARSMEETVGTSAVVLGVADQRVAFEVDAILEEQEVLVKHLTKPLSRVRNIAGATVLGSGQVAPVLNVDDLLKSARRAGQASAALSKAGSAPVAKSVLIAEDSITSRLLLKGILESAGYNVKTAVDGMDAFTTLRAEHFDLVVSDVEMPRLNGFDLTARIRADRKLTETPVILVTALESREDRERGIDAGANAYLIKSSFDQSNLLEAVRRLI